MLGQEMLGTTIDPLEIRFKISPFSFQIFHVHHFSKFPFQIILMLFITQQCILKGWELL